MSLFDRYFLVLAGKASVNELGVVASSALKSGVLTLSWPLNLCDENVVCTGSDLRASSEFAETERSVA